MFNESHQRFLFAATLCDLLAIVTVIIDLSIKPLERGWQADDSFLYECVFVIDNDNFTDTAVECWRDCECLQDKMQLLLLPDIDLAI